MKKKSFSRFFSMICAVLLLSSCNSDFPNLLGEYEQTGDPQTVRDKVLLIVVDGLRGEALQEVDPPFFYLMQRNSLYTYNSLVDYGNNEITKESAWATLFTGVYPQKHGVVNQDLSSAQFNTYEPVFKRLGEGRSSLVLGSSAFVSAVAQTADKTVVFNSDGELTNDVVNQIKTTGEDLIVLQYSDVNKVGIQYSFEDDDVNYKNAILSFDNQLQRVVESLRSRSSLSNENWLVIVTSTIGGDISAVSDDATVYGDPKRNSFTYFFSPRFSSKYLNKPIYTDIPFSGNSVNFRHSQTVAARLENPNLLNFTENQDVTINFFYKDLDPTRNLNYPVIMSKRAAPLFNSSTSHGWAIFRENGLWGINSSAISGSQAFGNVVNDGNWHAMTIVFNRSGVSDSVYVYTDGELGTSHGNGSVRSLTTSPLSNNVPFYIGRSPADDYNNTGLSYTISNVQFYNRAFTRREVKENYGVVNVDQDHPYYSNLVAYYPGYTDAGKNTITEATNRLPALQLSGNFQWYNFSEQVTGFRPSVTSSYFRLVPNAVDISFMIYQWMGVRIDQDWLLDGRSWAPNYSQIRN